MKKLMVIVVALVAGMAIATAQTQQVKKVVKKEVKQSKLKWLQTDVNLGNVPVGIPVTATYEFINKGKKPVVLTNVRTSCGCTKKSAPKEPVKPGKKSKVQATYNAARLGSFSKTVTVTTNEEGVAPKRLIIRGVVVAKNTENKVQK